MDMWLDIFLRGILIGLVVSMFSIGPVGVLCIQRTLSKGQRSGFFSGLGAATADTVYATVAFFAIAFVHGFIEQNQLLLKIIGGAFVVVVGLYIFFQNPVVQIRRNRSGKVSLWRDFLSIFLFTIANPAISLVFVGLFAMFGISNDAGYINGVAMLVGVLAGAAGWWFLFTFVLNIYRKRFRPRYLLWMNYRRTSWHRPPPMTSIFRTNMSLKCLGRKCLWSVICWQRLCHSCRRTSGM